MGAAHPPSQPLGQEARQAGEGKSQRVDAARPPSEALSRKVRLPNIAAAGAVDRELVDIF